MKITIESTTKIVSLSAEPTKAARATDVKARVWEGQTESGIKVYCFITRIAISDTETRIEEFEKELQATRVPSAEMMAFPSRLIL
jgi:hypothetical protein